MSRMGAGFAKYGGYTGRDRERDREEFEQDLDEDEEQSMEFPGSDDDEGSEEEDEYNPLEKADDWGRSGSHGLQKKSGVWGGKSKGWGFNKSRGMNGFARRSGGWGNGKPGGYPAKDRSRGLPIKEKSGPYNRSRGQSPFIRQSLEEDEGRGRRGSPLSQRKHRSAWGVPWK